MGKSVKVAVTGAAGQIGYALLFRIASGEMFGPDTDVHLRLLELEAALPALEGTAMELADCAFPLLKSVFMGAVAEEVFTDVDWAFLVGSVPRQAGMERGELLKVNGKVFVEQGKALEKMAKAECRVLVVGNPCNTNAFIAKSYAKRLSPENFYALMMLDQTRAQAQLALKAGEEVSAVKNIAVWGNHSATQYPNFFHGTIAGQPVVDVIDEAWLKDEFISLVQQRGAEIIRKRGKSSAASAANAVLATVRTIITPTVPGEFFSLAVCSDGSYGIEKGLIFGFPVRSDGKNVQIVGGLELNDYAQEKLAATERELKSEKSAVVELLGK